MRTYYVMTKMDNNVVLFKVNAESLLDAKDRVNEYCAKRNVTCYALKGFTESMLNEVPYAITTIKCGDGKSSRLIGLSDLNELKSLIKELREEYNDCSVVAKVTQLSGVELEIIRFYELHRGYDLEKSVEVAKAIASNVLEVALDEGGHV